MMGRVADHLFQVSLDGEADGGHRRIGRFVLEGVL